MTSDSIGIGIIGTGMIGSLHAKNLARRTRGARVVAVMDIDRARARTVADACDAIALTDAAELIARPQVDAVLIASPDASHAELAIACIRAGKPVLCEKPLATTLADAERVLQAEAACGRRLVQVGFMRVYDRAHRDVQAILQSGELGKALCLRGLHINPWRAPVTIEEAIVNSLIHDIHSARWLMPAEIDQVHTQWIRAEGEGEVARLARVHLRFADGAIGTLEWNGASGYGYEVGVEIVCERGAVQSTSHTAPVLRRGSTIAKAVTPDWPQRFAQAYVDEVQFWVNSIRAAQPTGPSAWDGFMALAVADACLCSVESGLPEAVAAPPKPEMY